MIAAKPVSLSVRPFKVSNLCFEAGGILGESFVELGAKVAAFPFGKLYKSSVTRIFSRQLILAACGSIRMALMP